MSDNAEEKRPHDTFVAIMIAGTIAGILIANILDPNTATVTIKSDTIEKCFGEAISVPVKLRVNTAATTRGFDGYGEVLSMSYTDEHGSIITCAPKHLVPAPH